MTDYNGVPERESEPPTKRCEFGVCPECGCEDLSEIAIGKMYRNVESWEDRSSWANGDEYFEAECSGGYCCNNCGDEFDTPEWKVEEL